MNDDFVGVIAILVIFGLPLSYAIVNRVFAHQERLEMLRRGMAPPPDPRLFKRMRGMPSGYEPYTDGGYQASCALRKGITIGMVGLALLVGLSFINPGTPGPWLLGGLIPLFVGIAQIIIAMLSGATFGRLGGPPSGMGAPPPGAQQPFGQQQSPFDTPPPTYGGWRPGPTTGLEKPPAPPDVR